MTDALKKLKSLSQKFDSRWSYHRKSCLEEEDDPQWKALHAGQARAWDDARQAVDKLIVELENDSP